MRMRVITLDERRFDEACKSLEHKVVGSGFYPDNVLAIKTGGAYVAERMFDGVPHEATTLRRPSSAGKRGVKGKVLRVMLRIMPRIVCDWLRILESKMLERQAASRLATPEACETTVSEAAKRVELPEISGHRILIVDDAVDTGVTLAAVKKAMREKHPEAEIRTAVITVTTEKSVIKPDYTLYDNRTLIRFLWSIDSWK